MSSASAIPPTQFLHEELTPAIVTLASTLTKLEELNLANELNAGPTEINRQSILNQFFQQINLFITQIKQAWNTAKPIIFDRIIETLINFGHQRKENPPLNFGSIYNFFRLFGLEEISHKTIERLSGALQGKIISTDWINYSFLIGYEKRLFLKTSIEQSKTLKNLFEILITMKKEEDEEKRFHKELDNITNGESFFVLTDEKIHDRIYSSGQDGYNIAEEDIWKIEDNLDDGFEDVKWRNTIKFSEDDFESQE